MKIFGFALAIMMAINGAHSQHHAAYGVPQQQQQQQVGEQLNIQTGSPSQTPQATKDRSIYARRASGISGVVSDVYEVFVGPSNYTYVLKMFLSRSQ